MLRKDGVKVGIRIGVEEITSADNAYIKQAAALRRKKERDESGLFAVEGAKFVLDALSSGWDVQYIFVTKAYAAENGIPSAAERVAVKVVNERLFGKITDEPAPQGLLAVMTKRYYDVDALVRGKTAPSLLLLDNVRDPGNVGSLIRAADAAGAAGVILSAGCADVYAPKTIRAAAGGVFRVPVVADVDVAGMIKTLREAGLTVYSTSADGDRLIYDADFRVGCAVVVGNEGQGVTKPVSDVCDGAVRLPMVGGAESLNAAVAGGIVMYEILRQRLVNGEKGDNFT